MSICAVIMAGGSGTRLWPLSRAMHPKQFLSLNGEDTMLQATVKRLSALDISTTVTICNEEHRFFVAEQLREIDKLGSIILEPVGRNTAPAIALAAFSSEDDPLLLVLAADHVIQDTPAFERAVTDAMPLAEAGKLVTFGIIPTEANTGYGYIKRGTEVGCGYAVDQFVEKPSAGMANGYLKSGGYYWNSGMFLFKASRYLEELKIHRPDIYAACQASMEVSSIDLDFLRIGKRQFESCASESIDYAVMEKTSEAVVVPLDAGWSDIGSWQALWEIRDKDPQGNVIYGDVATLKTTNSFIHAPERLVAVLGVDDLVIVDTKDALLVAKKDRVEDVKQIVEQIVERDTGHHELHREVYRPWGMYDAIDVGERHQVKRITVKPDAKLSLQMHHQRAEHWVVVSGTAEVTKDGKIFLLEENESTYIPIGCVHALKNVGETPLELIEIQTGAYLGEDDIVRFEDNYGRK